MKKIIAITVAALLFLASLAGNLYYLLDGDPRNHNPML